MSALIEHREHGCSTTLVIRRPTLRHLDLFLRLRCASDLVAWGVYPDAKEITESMGAYEAVVSRVAWGPGERRAEVGWLATERGHDHGRNDTV